MFEKVIGKILEDVNAKRIIVLRTIAFATKEDQNASRTVSAMDVKTRKPEN